MSAVFPPERGGMATVPYEEARALAGRHELTIFTLSAKDKISERRVDRSLSCNVVRLRAWPRTEYAGFAPQIFWKLRIFDSVYVHAPCYGLHEILWLARMFWKFKLVVTLHMNPVGAGWRAKLFPAMRFGLRALLRSADHVRVSSQRLRDAQIFRGCVSVKIIPFGVDTNLFSPAKTYPERTTFLFVGRLAKTHYFKGVALLLDAFKNVLSVKGDARLLIVGDGDERARYENRATSLGINRAIVFCGDVNDKELQNLYREASALVLPSTDTSETFGMVLLEAMSSGVPVIASRLPGVNDVVVDGVVGSLVEPGEKDELVRAMRDVFERPDVWKERAKAARERAIEFGSWGTLVSKLETLL